jgi:hypothetical protein
MLSSAAICRRLHHLASSFRTTATSSDVASRPSRSLSTCGVGALAAQDMPKLTPGVGTLIEPFASTTLVAATTALVGIARVRLGSGWLSFRVA